MKVIVVGSGIAGLSTAWALTKRGHAVTLLEQALTIPSPYAASSDHHRIIRRAYGKAGGYGRAITEAYEAWDEVWADLGENHLDPRGFICISREPGDEAEEFREGLEEGGYPLAMLSAEEAAVRWPFLDGRTIRYAFSSPEGGVLHCRKIASDMVAWLRAKGAEIWYHARVVSIDPERGRVRIGPTVELEGDLVIVTAGAWVTKLFPELAETLTTYRTAVVYLDPPADLKAVWEAAPVILDVGGRTDGWIIPPSGGAGLKFGSGLHKEPTDDADRDRMPRPGEGEALRDLFSPPIARLAEYGVKEVATCAYTFTGDETFFASASGKALIISACSGHGYKFGAAVGRRVAECIESGDVDGLKRWLRAEA